MTPTALRAEIHTGPHAAALAAFVTSGNDTAIAAFLNSPAGAGSGTVTLANMDRQRLLRALVPVSLAMAARTAAIQAKWDRIINMLRDIDTIPAAEMDAVFALAVTDTLLTTANVTAIKTRIGSRAEVLGDTQPITHLEVANALRGTL